MSLGGQLLRALVLVAVLARLVPMPPAMVLPFAVPVCHSDGGSDSVPERGKAHDCILCPVCLTAQVQAAVTSEAIPAAPIPPERAAAWVSPPATGPPAAASVVPPPRGPPA